MADRGFNELRRVLSRTLQCAECSADLSDRYVTSTCGHSFCAECLLCHSWASFPDTYKCPSCRQAVKQIRGQTWAVVRGDRRVRSFDSTWANGVPAMQWRLPPRCRQWCEETAGERRSSIAICMLFQPKTQRASAHRMLQGVVIDERPTGQDAETKRTLVSLFAALHWCIVPRSERQPRPAERRLASLR
jgi:hypothetical protein